jgi:hypothetical protein
VVLALVAPHEPKLTDPPQGSCLRVAVTFTLATGGTCVQFAVAVTGVVGILNLAAGVAALVPLVKEVITGENSQPANCIPVGAVPGLSVMFVPSR